MNNEYAKTIAEPVVKDTHLWLVNSSTTVESNTIADIEPYHKPSQRFYGNITNILKARGYVVSSDSSNLAEQTETLSETRFSGRRRGPSIVIKKLVESGQVLKARRVLSLMEPSQIQYFNLQDWNDLLEIPKTTRGDTSTGTPISGNAEIMRSKVAECRGEWIALRNGEYLDSDQSKVALYRRLKDKNELSGTMFIYADE